MNGPLPEGHFMQVEWDKLDNYEITIKVEEQGKRGRWKAIKVWEYKTRNMEFIESMEGKNTKLRD